MNFTIIPCDRELDDGQACFCIGSTFWAKARLDPLTHIRGASNFNIFMTNLPPC